MLSRLLPNDDIKRETARQRVAVEKGCSSVLSLVEKRMFLARVVHAQITFPHADSDSRQEIERAGTACGIESRTPAESSAVAWQFAVRQNLFQRFQCSLVSRCTCRRLTPSASTCRAYLSPLLHLCKHPPWLIWRCRPFSTAALHSAIRHTFQSPLQFRSRFPLARKLSRDSNSY